MGQNELLISLAFISVFALAVFGYASGFASDNNAYVSIDNDSNYISVKNNLEGNISRISTEADTGLAAFYRQSTTEGDQDTLKPTSSFRFLGSLRTNIKNIWKFVTATIFGGSSEFAAVTAIFLAVLGVIIGLLIWKTLKGGNPS